MSSSQINKNKPSREQKIVNTLNIKMFGSKLTKTELVFVHKVFLNIYIILEHHVGNEAERKHEKISLETVLALE